VRIRALSRAPGTARYADEQGHLTPHLTRPDGQDMMLAFAPTPQTARQYYGQLLRTYYRTFLSPSQRRYITERYGSRAYRRVLRGAMGITWEYLKLVVRPA
jgi:hypothetical protein